MEYLLISWELLVTSMVFTYPTWTIIIPTLSIQSENVDIKMQVRDKHANEHTALKRLGGDFTDRKKGWRCSLDRISKVYRYRHQKTKLRIKFNLYIGDSCHQKIKKFVTWGLKSQKFYVFFSCNPMEPFISGVRPYKVSGKHQPSQVQLFCDIHLLYISHPMIGGQCTVTMARLLHVKCTDLTENCTPEPKIKHVLHSISKLSTPFLKKWRNASYSKLSKELKNSIRI